MTKQCRIAAVTGLCLAAALGPDMWGAQQRFVDHAPMPPVTTAARQAGFVVFAPPHLSMLFPASVPRAGEIDPELSVSGAPGQVEPVVFALRALRQLDGITVRCSGLKGKAGVIAAGAIVVRYTVNHERPGQSRWAPWYNLPMLAPHLIVREAPATIPSDTSVQVWATLRVPPDAKTGLYTGAITIQAAGGPPVSRPVRLEVWPIRLAEPKGMAFMMLMDGTRDSRYYDQLFRVLRDHGMTSVSVATNLLESISMVEGRPRISWEGRGMFEPFMEAYKRAGFPESPAWCLTDVNEIGDVARWSLRFGDFGSEGFANAFAGVIREVVARGKQRGWPEIIFQWSNEANDHRDALQVREHALTIYPLIKQRVPEIMTALNGVGGPDPDLMKALMPFADGLFMHDGPFPDRRKYDPAAWRTFTEWSQKEGKRIWFYNPDNTNSHPEASRFIYGFGLWLCRPARGARLTRLESPDAPNLSIEGAREGIYDYRYMLTLEELKKRSRSSSNARVRALADQAEHEVGSYLDRVTFEHFHAPAIKGEWMGEKRVLPNGDREVSGPYKVRNGWEFSTYDEVRRLVASWIIRLQGAERSGLSTGSAVGAAKTAKLGEK